MSLEVAGPALLILLSDVYWKMGQIDEGLRRLSEALSSVGAGRYYAEAEMHRLRGELLLCPAIADASQAETSFQQALDLSRHQQTKSLELRAATSLARLWQSQEKRQEAYDLLAPVYEWFTEGFDTADLIETKALLDELE